jgi:RIO-like serine/threonine protein kinase
MSTTLKIDNINQLLEENRAMVGVASSPTCLYILHLIRSRPEITLDQINTEFTFRSGTAEDWLRHILEVGLVELKDSKYSLTQLGERKLALTDISLEELGGTEILGTEDVPNKLPDSYRLDSIPLGKGATSVTFRAIQQSTGLPRTVKIFRLGITSYDQLKSFRQKRKTIPKEVAIPDFIGMGQFYADLESHDKPVVLDCQVFEYVNEGAKTLQEYVNTDPAPYLSRDFFRFFVEHVGGALEAIERAGLQHGDLHARNILVILRERREPAISFKVIDFAGGSSFNSLTFSGVTDLEMFKRHLIWCFLEVCRQRPGVSARELVGDGVERVIIGLQEQKYENFAELLDDFHKRARPIPTDYFQEPTSRLFKSFRVEMMPSLEELYLLFEPDESVFEAISGSDNVIISGPRGCGKSHYLRTLNFWPEILKLEKESTELKAKLELIRYDFHRFFGILFECRVGEFKNFSPEAVDGKKFTAETVRVLKHILVLKIINKTLSVLREGCESEVLIPPQNISALRTFIQERFPDMLRYGEPNAVEEMTQYARALVTKEKQAEPTWNLSSENRGLLLYEPDVEAFFESLQKDFPDLARTQFFILVDDISEGRMHPEMQKVLNSIMTSATKRFCFKVTCDKFMYTLDTAEGRAIDPSQDVVYVDLGDLSVKAQRPRKAISKYVQDIVNARLNAWFSQKSDIVTILGDSQEPKEFLTLLRRPRKKTRQATDAIQKDNTRRKALYAGWNIVWQLSHGSIRTLFQLLDYIFAQSNFERDNPGPIPLDSQDKYVREFSKHKSQSLLMLKGSIDGTPLGTPISNVARSIGEISRLYLTKYDTGEPDRFYETITLEKLDLNPLSERAAEVLKYLVVYDVLMITGITFSRAQVGLSERYDLNKIYAPSFQTTYRVRNHLYLSRDRFEQLLLEPGEFIKSTRARLDNLVKHKKDDQQKTLFEED